MTNTSVVMAEDKYNMYNNYFSIKELNRQYIKSLPELVSKQEWYKNKNGKKKVISVSIFYRIYYLKLKLCKSSNFCPRVYVKFIRWASVRGRSWVF